MICAYHEKYERNRVGFTLVFVFDNGLSLVVRAQLKPDGTR